MSVNLSNENIAAINKFLQDNDWNISIIKREEYKKLPSDKYEFKHIGTWNSKEDVDAFFRDHTYENGWSGLNVGNYITINDGTYNKDWIIAHFNSEEAADKVPGGIVFVPREDLVESVWDNDHDVVTGYIDSYIHNRTLPIIEKNLYDILGQHMILRNVKLGSYCKSDFPRPNTTSGTEDSKAYLTLMSTKQLGINSIECHNIYDDGEANYVLRLFNSNYGEGSYMTTIVYYGSGYYPWFRNVWGTDSFGYFFAWFLDSNGSVDNCGVNSSSGVRPLLYLR